MEHGIKAGEGRMARKQWADGWEESRQADESKDHQGIGVTEWTI